MGRSSFQCLAPAKQICGGGVVLAVLAWMSWAVLFGSFVGLRNRALSCDDICYDPSFCWSSNVTSSPSTICVNDGITCLEDCAVPYESQFVEKNNATANATTHDDGSLCRLINYCDEMVQEESEKVDECAMTACDGAAPAMTTLQSVMTLLGLLLILLSGTLCLNFYREAVVCPPRRCSPCKEALGRVVLYGSVSGAAVLFVLVLVQMVEFARNGMPGGMADLAVTVLYIYVIVINAILVLFACAGRSLLAEADAAREVSAADGEEEPEVQTARVF